MNKSVQSAFIIKQVLNKNKKKVAKEEDIFTAQKMEPIKEDTVNEHIQSQANIIQHPESLLPTPKRQTNNSLFTNKGHQTTIISKNQHYLKQYYR